MKTLVIIIVLIGAQLHSVEQTRTEPEAGKESYSTYSIENLPDITPEDIDQLMEFRQPLEYDSHEWTEEQYFTDSQLHNFYNELLEKWVRPFDWREWRRQAWQYYKNPSSLEEAQLPDIVKTITFHVRKDRVCKGHLLALIQHGHMGEILSRLRKIRATLAKPKQSAKEKETPPSPAGIESPTF